MSRSRLPARRDSPATAMPNAREPHRFYWVVSAAGVEPAIARLNADRVFCFTDWSRLPEAAAYWAADSPLEPPSEAASCAALAPQQGAQAPHEGL